MLHGTRGGGRGGVRGGYGRGGARGGYGRGLARGGFRGGYGEPDEAAYYPSQVPPFDDFVPSYSSNNPPPMMRGRGGLFGAPTAAGNPFEMYGEQQVFPPPIPEDEPAMGKRMVTVEVTGTQSATLRSKRFAVTGPEDIEVEVAAVAAALAERGCASGDEKTILYTSVSGRLMDKSGAVVLEVYPFVVRTSVGAGCEELAGVVRDHLCAGVHPAPCGLYARRVSKCGDVSIMASGDSVVAAAKELLCGGGAATLGLCWDVRVCATVVEASKVTKEVEVVPKADFELEREGMPPPGDSWATMPIEWNTGRLSQPQGRSPHQAGALGGLFGQQQQAGALEGLIVQQQQLSMLFSQQQQQQSMLFSQQQQQPSMLFGQQQQQPSTLFGQLQQQSGLLGGGRAIITRRI